MKFSIVVPIYNMDNAEKFLKRNLDSIFNQTFKDYEVVVSDDSQDDLLKIFCTKYKVRYVRNKGLHNMADNTNNAIEHAKGEWIKILYQDDYFADDQALERLEKRVRDGDRWIVTGCTHAGEDGQRFNDHLPIYAESDNMIGSPSVLTIHRSVDVRFDNTFYWVLDLDLYKQLFRKYGKPHVVNDVNVVIGIGSQQTTHKLSDQRKALEHQLLIQKYDTRT